MTFQNIEFDENHLYHVISCLILLLRHDKQIQLFIHKTMIVQRSLQTKQQSNITLPFAK